MPLINRFIAIHEPFMAKDYRTFSKALRVVVTIAWRFFVHEKHPKGIVALKNPEGALKKHPNISKLL